MFCTLANLLLQGRQPLARVSVCRMWRHFAWHPRLRADSGEGARAVLLLQGSGPSQLPNPLPWLANILQIKLAGVFGTLPNSAAHPCSTSFANIKHKWKQKLKFEHAPHGHGFNNLALLNTLHCWPSDARVLYCLLLCGQFTLFSAWNNSTEKWKLKRTEE